MAPTRAGDMWILFFIFLTGNTEKTSEGMWPPKRTRVEHHKLMPFLLPPLLLLRIDFGAGGNRNRPRQARGGLLQDLELVSG